MKKIILLLVLAFVIVSCSGSDKTEEKKEERVVDVKVLKVDESVMPSMRTFSANVSSDKIAVITPKVMGQVEKINVNPGDKVKKGDLLFTLSSQELQDKLTTASNGVEEAETGRSQAEIGLRMAKLQEKQAEYDYQLAEKTYNRYSNLLAKSSVSRQEFDQVEAKFKQAREALNIATQNVELAEQQLRQVKFKKRQAISQRAEVSRYVDYLEVRAPFDGIVLEKMMDVGNLASPATPVIKIGNNENVIYAMVSERLISEIKPGTKAVINAEAIDLTCDSTVLEVSPKIDRATGNFLVKLEGHEKMVNGMYAQVRFETGKDDVLMVPETSVVKRGQLSVVFVENGGRADMRVVKTGRTRLGWIEILSGLEKGEVVVIGNANVLKNGDRLKIQ